MSDRPIDNPHAALPEATEITPEDLVEQHPADVAQVLEDLPTPQAVEVLEALPAETAADALEQLEHQEAEQLVADMAPQQAAKVVAHMALDDATDVLAQLPAERRELILACLPLHERQVLEALLTYDPESAGGIMSPEVTALDADLTVDDAIAALRRMADASEQVYYSYVVDAEGRLVGVLSLRDVLLARRDQKLREIMIQRVVSVPHTLDREEVARTLTKYGYLALPVVDEAKRLLGIVTVDDVLDVITDEATEDMQRMVGAGGDERIDSAVSLVLRRRLYWLMINLGTGFLAAAVVGGFEQTLAKVTALAVLMPIVAGQAGNTGLQSMAVMIRAISTGETRNRSVMSVMLREVSIGLAAGAAVGLVCMLATLIWNRMQWNDTPLVAVVIGVAMVACMTMATVSGALVPIVMKRLGFDPAQSSSIILTTITDVSGFGIFLGLGTWLLLR
ncbi:MAG TPA: magnesium transporter [Phycisphaerae bacterium]|nr:magnesium transporter [Phycisphaerae bacterium]